MTTSRANLRKFLKRDEDCKIARLKAAVVHDVFDFRYNGHVIEVLLQWDSLSDPVWEEVTKVRECRGFAEVVGRITTMEKCSAAKFCSTFNENGMLHDDTQYPMDILLPQFNVVEFSCYMLLYEKVARHGGIVGPNVMKEFQRWGCLASLNQKRIDQLKSLDDLRNHIYEIGSIDIIFENKVDFEIPRKFNYVKESFSTSVDIPKDPIIGCTCRKCNDFSTCCGEMSGISSLAYNKDRTLKLIPGKAIYECNSRCKCDSTCINRVVQSGISLQLSVFKTTECGWGLMTLHDLKAGQFVCEYVGEIIDYNEANERGKTYDNIGLTYLFDLDYNSPEKPFTVDAYEFGNVSRFMNHSCIPNCAIWVVFVDCLDPNLPRLGIFTTRAVEQGEELTFDYNVGQIPIDGIADSQKKTKRIGQCFCKSRKCRNYLFETLQD